MIEQTTTPGTLLTERQQREREFYDVFGKLNEVKQVVFDPVLGIEQRPWNSYWSFYGRVRNEHNRPGQRLLDFGCGAGVASVKYAHVGFEVWGFDLSPTCVANAEALAATHGFADRCHFSVGTAERLAYDDASFDVVAGLDILHHVEIPLAIEEVHRVLKPGGLAIFREHVEAPVLDSIRNTGLVRALIPKQKSFEREITEDERKLTDRDLEIIRSRFPSLEVHPFRLLSRADLMGNQTLDTVLEKIDHTLLQRFPFLARLGGAVVLEMRKL